VAAAIPVGGSIIGVASAANGRVIWQPEGMHGGWQAPQDFWMFAADPASFRKLGEPWVVPHRCTTAYANMPINYPLVDGRLFVRGHDALYCYDVRKAAGK
jgi:hypothetical protein